MEEGWGRNRKRRRPLIESFTIEWMETQRLSPRGGGERETAKGKLQIDGV